MWPVKLVVLSKDTRNIRKSFERYVVALLFEALRYKPEGSGFDSRRSNWNFSLT
jgi:hypothetical protein